MRSLFRLMLSIVLVFICSTGISYAGNFIFVGKGKACPIVLVDYIHNPIGSAAKMLTEDVATVTGITPVIVNGFSGSIRNKSLILAGTIGANHDFDRYLKKHQVETASLKGAWEAYRLQVLKIGGKTQLLVLGSDPRGTAYGLLEISRQMGVSPWVWWADAKPVHKDLIEFPLGFIKQDKPSVQYRGIFLNDEDWGLMPWATQTLAPQSAKGAIGPEAYTRICQLLLRLRANLLWPAMHETTVPFYFVPGNADVARKYGIFVGTSHCEPLMRNSAGEWDKAAMGDYNYTTNSANVLNYWKERVHETVESPCLYTMGMRGVHDGKMQGATSLTEQKELLQRVIVDQRQLLTMELKKPLMDIPQVFIPYKEVLDVYNEGLNVPDDITLIWCDDNYGHISRLSNAKEQTRSGGSGVYYHLSYWGRPHDYLWLASTSPAQVQFEMTRAWEQNARKLWVANVGDIKPGEYLTEYFLDLAWNVGKDKLVDSVKINKDQPLYADHLRNFLSREFGSENSDKLSDIMQTYYHLATLRKPEHMGWTRVEESGFPAGRSPIIDTEFNNEEMNARINAYTSLENQVKTIAETLPGTSRAAFYQLVGYQVYAASLLNQKILYAQMARQAEARHLPEAASFAAASLFAYKAIQNLTNSYNEEMSAGKWNQMMSDNPRNLAVFAAPFLPEKYKNITPKAIVTPRVVLRSGAVSNDFKSIQEVDFQVSFPASIAKQESRPSGLGHSLSAVRLKKGESLRFEFNTISRGTAELRVYTLPNFAVDGGNLRYEIELNNATPVQVNTKTTGRSEAWKQQVLRNQTVAKIPFNVLKSGKQVLVVTALDNDVVLDQIMLDFKTGRKGYLVPCTVVCL